MNNEQKFYNSSMDGASTSNQSAPAVSDNSTQRENNTIVNRVSVKVPPFWPEQPEIWFAQVEAQFGIARINSDNSKFNTVVAAIESGVLAQVSDAILNPPEDGKYNHLKACIIERYCDSEQKKIQKLISDIDLGDKRPTQLLNELRGLAKGKINDDFLKTLWLQRLPAQTRAILQASNADLPELAKLADKILEVSDYQQVAAVSSRQYNDDDIGKRIERMEQQINQLVGINEQRFRSRSKQRFSKRRDSRSATPSTSGSQKCWYHERFGNSARKCRPPCNFSTNQVKN